MVDCSISCPLLQADDNLVSPNLSPRVEAHLVPLPIPIPDHDPDHDPDPDPDPDPDLPLIQPLASQHSPRASISPSEPASTTFGSDNERVFSSGDEDSMGFQSDTAYDSVATRATTNSGSGLSGLEIERLFNGSPPPEVTKGAFLPLAESAPHVPISEPSPQDENSLDGLDSLSTPRDDHSSNQGGVSVLAPTIASPETHIQHDNPPSSPPTYFKPEIRRREEGPTEPNPVVNQCPPLHYGELWDDELLLLDLASDDHSKSPELPQHDKPLLSPPLLEATQNPFTQQWHNSDDVREEKRLSIFHWSEQPRSDRDSLYGSSPRPRTVHSKQANDARGRAPGRRAPNTLHFRSQSVPAARESHMDSDPAYPPAKYGTWGLGKKGVSEEWTDDFEFEEGDDHGSQNTPSKLTTSMKVPQAIIDRQASVHGQFGQVQEFMLLVEELKRLRHQGNTLNLMAGSSTQLWKDAENIIDLATLNEDDEMDQAPLSPGFSAGFDDFDEDSLPLHRPRQLSSLGTEDALTLERATTATSTPATPPTGRPRRESLAQAKSFLQTMHQSRVGFGSSPLEDRHHPPKLPFDTQDLRDLVIRTGVVTRALKDIVRKGEGVLTTPERLHKEPQDPPFSQIFNRPESESPTAQKPRLPKSTSVNSYINASLTAGSNERDLSTHMNMMAVV